MPFTPEQIEAEATARRSWLLARSAKYWEMAGRASAIPKGSDLRNRAPDTMNKIREERERLYGQAERDHRFFDRAMTAILTAYLTIMVMAFAAGVAGGG